MILHIPHSSIHLLSMVTLTRELENLYYYTDFLTDKIFCSGKGEPIIFPLSRFVCDVERLPNDPLEEKGQGIIYRKDFFGNDIIRNNSDEEIMKIYNEHHIRLNKAVAQSLTLLPKCVVVDCHSFPSIIADDIDVCVGIDKLHTSPQLFWQVYNYFHHIGVRARANQPFKGTLIPSNYIGNENVESIMLEINKDMYAFSDLESVKSLISGALDIIYEYEYNSE